MPQKQQIRNLEDLKGKTILDVFKSDEWDNYRLCVVFSDETFAVFEGQGNDRENDVGLSETISNVLHKQHGFDNQMLVRLGLKTQEDLDAFNIAE